MSSLKIVGAILILAICLLKPCPMRSQGRIDCIEASVEPDKCLYRLEDTVLMTIRNTCSDTALIYPALLSFGSHGWDYVVADLQRYWRNRALREGPDDVTPQALPPHGEFQLRVTIADIAASFRGQLLLRFEVRGLIPRTSSGISHDHFWVGPQFMLRSTSREEDSILNIRQRGSYKRDTVFALYDPIANTPVIASEVLVRHPYRLILWDPFDTVEISSAEKTRIEIIWDAPSIDGSLELVVTKRQLWLRSSHNNPNPDELFWVANIAEGDFDAINKALARRHGDFEEVIPERGFSRYLYWKRSIPEMPLPSEWTDSTIQISTTDFEEKRYLNAKRLIDIINEAFPAKKKIRFPGREKLNQIRAVRLESTL